MSSEPFDVLATAFLWVLCCFGLSVVLVRVAGDEKPPAPLFTICLHHVEPQTVPPAPLLPVDIPPPREPAVAPQAQLEHLPQGLLPVDNPPPRELGEPAVAPQAQHEPLPEGLPPSPEPELVEPAVALRPEPQPHRPTRRNDRIPRGERLLRPTVSAERPIQRERHMTEMSTRDRIAACDREAAQERYEAHKAQDLLWRKKVIDYEAAEAERKQEAASRTGGQAISANAPHSQEPTDKASDTLAIENGNNERKQLNIDSEAANNFTGKRQIENRPHDWSNAHIGTALGDKSDTAYASPMEYEKTTETQSDNPLLNLNDKDAADGLNAQLIELQDAEIDGLADAAWDRKVLLVYTHWQQWITCGNTLIWNFDKHNEAQIEQLEPIVEDMFAIFQKRCGKRNVNSPADGLDETLAIVSMVRGNMKKALNYLKGINSGQPATLDQPPSVTYGQFTSDEQHTIDEQFSLDQEQAQIAADLELAEFLHLQETPQVAAFASSSRIPNEQADQQSNNMQAPNPPNAEQLDTLSVNKASTSPPEGTVAAAPAHSDGIRASRWATADDVTQTPNPPNTEQLETLPIFEVSTPIVSGGGLQASRDANAVDPREATVAAVPALGGGIEDSGYASADDEMIGIEEQTNTATVNTPVNPLLKLRPSDAWKELASSLSEATSIDPSMHDEAWCQNSDHMFVCWWQWVDSMERNGVNIWSHVEGRDVVQFAAMASAAQNSINLQFWDVTSEVKMVCDRMVEEKIYVEQEQARIFEEQQRQYEERRRTTEIQQQQQQLAAEKEEEQARIMEEQRQEAIRVSRMQRLQQPTWTLPTKVEPIPEYFQTTGLDRMGVEDPSAQPDPAMQQQHVGAAPFQPDQQAPAAPLANVNALPAMRQSTQGEPQTNAANMTAQKTEQLSQDGMETSATDTGARDVVPAVQSTDIQNSQPTLVQLHYPTNELQKQLQDSYRMSQDRAKDDEAAAGEVKVEKTSDEIATENALAHGWKMSDIKLEDGMYPLQGEVRFSDQDLVLVTTWLKLNNELVKSLQKHRRDYKREATSTTKRKATSPTQGEYFMVKIQQMSYRYCELRQYTCVPCSETGEYDWNVGRISLKDIKENGLKEYIHKDEEFLTAVRNSFNTPDEVGIDEIRELEIDDCKTIVVEAHTNITAVSTRSNASFNDHPGCLIQRYVLHVVLSQVEGRKNEETEWVEEGQWSRRTHLECLAPTMTEYLEGR